MKGITNSIRLLLKIIKDELATINFMFIKRQECIKNYNKIYDNLTDILPYMNYYGNHNYHYYEFAIIGIKKGTIISIGIYDTEPTINYFNLNEAPNECLMQIYDLVNNNFKLKINE